MIRGFLLSIVLLAGACLPAAAQQSALLPFLVQSICLDAAGRPEPGLLPFEPGCTRRAPQRQDAPMPYRRHDWPAAQQARSIPQGYQASDAVLGSLLGVPAAVQTFDFGAGENRRFGTHDRGRGDGGQVIPLGPGPSFIAMTEDAGGGVQWFLSPDCRSGGRGWQGWLLAGPGAGDAWTTRVMRLRIAPSPQACPTAFDASLTRFRRTRLALPWREAATGQTGSITVDAIVSEHYGGADIATAHHLERFVLARDLGMVRWERWENAAVTRDAELPRQAERLRQQQRCPALSVSTAPGPGWFLRDCRFWTNFVRAAPGQPLAALPWPPRDLR
ncbi:hypothetical protein KPL78_03735 [Roseomonas sp. HJA6]|uniref:DUF1311 domain-containing protein n=1 Tax=Roseomonas alba TaxID=2846776 RepID=A0ABS7A3R5_9PROT|nr:hypothetical protein [Neoroseomonas alba]MBW6396942.1 hypothetical protein [Neoroseomonas alba]